MKDPTKTRRRILTASAGVVAFTAFEGLACGNPVAPSYEQRNQPTPEVTATATTTTPATPPEAVPTASATTGVGPAPALSNVTVTSKL